jgi:hypothetical protein
MPSLAWRKRQSRRLGPRRLRFVHLESVGDHQARARLFSGAVVWCRWSSTWAEAALGPRCTARFR